MKPVKQEKDIYKTMEGLMHSFIEVKLENEQLKKEIQSLRAQLNEKDARLLEAKSSTNSK